MSADTLPTGEELKAYLEEWRTYYLHNLERQREIERRAEQFYFQEATRLVKLAYSEDDPDDIREWLNRKYDFIAHNGSDCEDDASQAETIRDKYDQLKELQDLACFFILAPVPNTSMPKRVVGYDNYNRVYYDHQDYLEKELESVKKIIPFMGELFENKMADHVIAHNFDEAENGVNKFIQEMGTKARRVAIFFLGHGTTEGGIMSFGDGHIENNRLVDVVKKYKREYCIRGATESFWLVFGQCFGHVGLEELQAEVQEEHAEDAAQNDFPDGTECVLQLDALATSDKPKPSARVEWWDLIETELDDPAQPRTTVLKGILNFAWCKPLDRWIRTHLKSPEDESAYEEVLMDHMQGISISDEES